MRTTIGLVDDHQLFLKSLSLMLASFGNYDITVEALNGRDLINKLNAATQPPDLLLVDVNMPVMDGIATCKWVNEQYPAVKMVALSMNDSDTAIIEMLKAGCVAYLLKDTHPTELEKALSEIVEKGYYNSDTINITFRKMLTKQEEKKSVLLSDREQIFLGYACSEMTYKQIAAKMNLSERTIDGYRESLFEKFHVQSRVGLCLEALRKGYVQL